MDPFSDGGAGRRSSWGKSSRVTARTKLLVAAGAAILTALVLVLIATNGSGSDERVSGSTPANESQPEAGLTDAAQENEGSIEGEQAGPGAGEPEQGDAAPDGSGEDGAIEDSADGGAQGGPIPERAQDPDVAPKPGAEVQSSHHDGESAYVQAPEGGPEPGGEWVKDQPEGGHDPLGRNADPSGLAGPEKERVRFAASSYVTYAYGYTGDDLSEYHEQLFETMVEERFQDSPGRADIRAVEDDIEDGGAKSAAVLDHVDVQQANGDEVRGVAYFTVGESYDGSGVSGESTSLAQPLNLERSGTDWRVVAADRLQEVSGG